LQGSVSDPNNPQNTSRNTYMSVGNPSLQSLIFGLMYSFS